MAETLHDLVAGDKLIAAPADWTKKGRRLEIKLPLEIEGVVEEGLFFRGCALEHLPDQEVMFQLEYHGVRVPGGTGPLTRIEWNSLRPHNNKGKGPVELRFVEQRPSHVHRFEDNWSDSNGALLKDNLPIARPITEPIQGFTECLILVGKLFRISNIDVVKAPEWVYALDLGNDL
jgi:hypothetical protein